MTPAVSYAAIEQRFAGTGLIVRGGFSVLPEDDLEGATVVLVGNAGPAMWTAFSASRENPPDCSDPLDRWTALIVDPRAGDLAAQALYPNDRPYRPFQRWAMRCEPVAQSPLGLLIHPQYGLWHAYRAALVFATPVAGVPTRAEEASPCDSCAAKPCLRTCPVGAFTGEAYEVPVCVGHLTADADALCHQQGCLARIACPIGTDHLTPPSQRAYHTATFLRANT
ncbi:MAG: hypothetical protein AAFQ42_14125 [Pseudomonadota bacterium]